MLRAYLYDNNLSSPSPITNILMPTGNIRLLWELNGGLQSIEMDWIGHWQKAYTFYRRYIGYRVIVVDQFCDRPVADGFITGLAMTPTGIQILASGAWFRHFDQLYAFDTTAQDYQQGTLSYESGGVFRDTGQDFSDWNTGSGDAQYKIEVFNTGQPDTKYSNVTDTDNHLTSSDGNADREWYAERFRVDINSQIVRADVEMKKVGTPAGTMTASVYTESQGRPGEIVGNASQSLNINSSLGTSYSDISFTWASNGPTLDANTDYFLVIKTSGYTYSNGVTEVVIGSDSDGRSEEANVMFKYDADASTNWTSVGSGHSMTFSIYTSNVGSITWGFMGDVGTGGNTYIKVYRNWECDDDTQGWLGDTDFSDLTPYSYQALKNYAYKTTSEVIKEALTNDVPFASDNQSNIDETNTVVGFWEPPIEQGGMYPGELIDKLSSWSDSSNNQWNYWLKNAAFDGTSPQKPIPYFKAQVNDGTYDWSIYRSMLAPSSRVMERSVQEMRNAVKVIYRDMENDGVISIEPQISYLTDTTSISDYWRREIIVSAGDATRAIAENYAELYREKFSNPLLSKSIVLSSGYILDSYNKRYPLWSPIKYSKSYFKISDLIPTADLLTSSWDRLQCSQATSMEYSSTNNQLRIVLDLEDDSLDALVARMSDLR